MCAQIEQHIEDIGLEEDVQKYVKTVFRNAVKKMMPKDHVSAHTQFSSYTNNEGIFGDPEMMSMTEDGHKNQIPTYQLWSQEGKTAHTLQLIQTHASHVADLCCHIACRQIHRLPCKL